MRRSFAVAAALSVIALASGAKAQPAAPAAVAPQPSGPPAAHKYVLVANAELPLAGSLEASPFVVVFVDVATIKRDGDAADVDVVYALGRPQVIAKRDTSFIVFQHQINCATNRIKLLRYITFDQKGAGLPTLSTDPEMPATGANNAIVAKYACDAQTRPAAGYAGLEGVLLHAHAFDATRHEGDTSIKHAFVLVGGAATSPYGGPFDVFVDSSTLVRDGDQVTAQALEVFTPTPQPDPNAPAFDIDTVTYQCAAKMGTTSFSVLYRGDGIPLRAALTGASAQPVKPGAVSERMAALACNNVDPKIATAPTLPAAVNGARQALAKAVADKAAGTPTGQAPAGQAPASPAPAAPTAPAATTPAPAAPSSGAPK
ncbi:MAG: surface-adhesin E family protein [Caulobacterales bacterium]